MIFFKKKKPDPQPAPSSAKKTKSFQDIAHERILTAEGWRRQVEMKGSKPKAK